jgi:hypothetical protein
MVKYKGQQFDSELHARWAVFFDAIQVPWWYKQTEIDLGHVGIYRPNFWIPAWSAWVEVRQNHSTPDHDEWEVFEAIGKQAKLLIVCGPPQLGRHTIRLLEPRQGDHLSSGQDIGLHDDEAHYITFTEFAVCRRCDNIVLLALLSDGGPYAEAGLGEHTCEPHDKWPSPGDSFPDAYKLAMRTRF